MLAMSGEKEIKKGVSAHLSDNNNHDWRTPVQVTAHHYQARCLLFKTESSLPLALPGQFPQAANTN